VEETLFSAEKLSFLNRIKRGLIVSILMFLILEILPLTLYKKIENPYIFLLIPIFILSMIIVIMIIKAKKYVYGIKINQNEIIFYGNNFNSEWIEKSEVQNVNIQIIEDKAKGGGIIGYRIVFKNSTKRITVNILYNWNNFTLYKLFAEFKKAKGEKITKEENLLLDGIRKKAKYYDE